MISWGTSRNLINNNTIDINIETDYKPVYGSLIHIYGNEASGKTRFLLNIMNAVDDDTYILYFMGKQEITYQDVIDINHLYIIIPEYIEYIFETIDKILDIKSNRKYLFIIDDLSSMRSEYEKDYKSMRLSIYTEQLQKLIRMVSGKIYNRNAILFMVTQMRMNIKQGRLMSQIHELNNIVDISYEFRKIYDGYKSYIAIKCVNNIKHIHNTFYYNKQLQAVAI